MSIYSPLSLTLHTTFSSLSFQTFIFWFYPNPYLILPFSTRMPSNLSYLRSFCPWCQLRLDRQVGWAWAVCHKLGAATSCQVKAVTSGRTRFWHLYQPSGDIHPYRMHTSCPSAVPRLSRLPFLWLSRHKKTFSSLEQKSQVKNICLLPTWSISMCHEQIWIIASLSQLSIWFLFSSQFLCLL